jgi:hypothetical protein
MVIVGVNVNVGVIVGVTDGVTVIVGVGDGSTYGIGVTTKPLLNSIPIVSINR